MPRRCTVYLLGLADPFDRWCASQGKGRSLALRELIGKAVDEPLAIAPAGSPAPGQSPPQARADVPRARAVHLRFEQRELESLRRQSAAAALPAARYLASVLAAVEQGRTVVAGKEALEALAQSNYELAWLGRKLQQIARALEASPRGAGDSGEGQALHEAILALRKHLARAAAVLADIENTRCLRLGCSPRATRTRIGRRQ